MSSKPALKLSTPVTANFPHIQPPASELRSAVSLPSAVSSNTPLSAISRTSAFREPILSSGLPSAGLPSAGPFSATLKLEHGRQKTPITPPIAYLDFLRGVSLVSPRLASPPQTGKSMLNRTSTASSTLSDASSTSSTRSTESGESDKEKGEQIESAPSTARSDTSCGCDEKDKDNAKEKDKGEDENKPKMSSSKPAPIQTKRPPTPPAAAKCPLSAPPAGPSVFPSMKIPVSPAVSASGLYSPRSPLGSAVSVKSPFDWEAALKSRRFAADTPGSKRPAGPETPGIPPTAAAAATPGTAGSSSKRESRSSSIRHIREVVTRTVTYTPRMGPAPKGKRRKIDAETAVNS